MEKLGTSAKKVLEFINEKNTVTNEELMAKFGDEVCYPVAALQIKKLICHSTSSDDEFDYCVSPTGKDYLERASVEDVKDQQLSDHHLTVKHIDTTVVDLSNRVAILERGLEEESKRAELAKRNNWKISLVITLVGSAFGVLLSVIVGIFIN